MLKATSIIIAIVLGYTALLIVLTPATGSCPAHALHGCQNCQSHTECNHPDMPLLPELTSVFLPATPPGLGDIVSSAIKFPIVVKKVEQPPPV